MDPLKAKLFRFALEVADRILCWVLGQKQTVSDHLMLRLTAKQAELGARLNPHSRGGLVLG